MKFYGQSILPSGILNVRYSMFFGSTPFMPDVCAATQGGDVVHPGPVLGRSGNPHIDAPGQHAADRLQVALQPASAAELQLPAHAEGAHCLSLSSPDR